MMLNQVPRSQFMDVSDAIVFTNLDTAYVSWKLVQPSKRERVLAAK